MEEVTFLQKMFLSRVVFLLQASTPDIHLTANGRGPPGHGVMSHGGGPPPAANGMQNGSSKSLVGSTHPMLGLSRGAGGSRTTSHAAAAVTDPSYRGPLPPMGGPGLVSGFTGGLGPFLQAAGGGGGGGGGRRPEPFDAFLVGRGEDSIANKVHTVIVSSKYTHKNLTL